MPMHCAYGKLNRISVIENLVTHLIQKSGMSKESAKDFVIESLTAALVAGITPCTIAKSICENTLHGKVKTLRKPFSDMEERRPIWRFQRNRSFSR